MNFFSIAGLTVVLAALVLVFRRHKPEYALFIAIAGGLVILLVVINQVEQVFRYAEQTFNNLKIPFSSVVVLIKALGISYVSQFASDICKDAGENTFSSNIELVGKVAIIIVALPLLSTFVGVIQKILG